MRRPFWPALVLIGALASQHEAGAFQLDWPVACTVGTDCVVQNYVDHDNGAGARDFTCGSLSYDGHRGTDIRVATDREIAGAGVMVRSAAEGVVIATRDGMPDRALGRQGGTGLAAVAGSECGNGVILDHADGWRTRYCHLAQGSVAVAKGDRIAAGTPLGRIGLSGATAFPHLHFGVERHGAVIDPFAPTGATCASPTIYDTLWRDPPRYLPGGLLAVGTLDGIPKYDAVQQGLPPRPTAAADAPALVVWLLAFGVLAGDRIDIHLARPGADDFRDSVQLDRDQAQVYRALGRKRPAGGWPAGSYSGEVTLVREGAVIDRRPLALRIGD